MQEDSVPENPSDDLLFQIYKIISPALMDPNARDPTDYEAGTDFVNENYPRMLIIQH